MPTSTVKPREVIHNGKRYWRVITPKDLRGDGPRMRFFDGERDAADHAEILNKRRGNAVEVFAKLASHDQINILAAFHVAGSSPKLLTYANDGKARLDAVKPVPLVSVVSECLESKQSAGLRPRSIRALKSSLTMFTNSHPVNIGELSATQIEAWLSSNGWSAATRRGYLTDIRTLLSFALKRGYVTSNPGEAIAKPKWDGGAPGIHTVDEASKLLAMAHDTDPGLLGYIAPIYFGGLRPAESDSLNFKQVRFDLIEVTPENSKTRRRRFIPVNDTLKAWLDVPGVQFSPINLVRRMRRLIKKAGVSWSHDVMRHSFCSYGLPVFGAQKIAEWAGHSEAILFAHYRERVTPEAAKEFWALRPK